MKIHCVGAGPAGLYFSILLKAREPKHDIRVYERHQPHDTEGWGVVFSGRTCDDLARTDPVTWSPVTRELVAWDAIEVHAHGERVRTNGHAFCGIARDRFTSVLQERARALGVDLCFEVPIDDPEPLRDCDLLVGADGFGSVCRKRWEDAFSPSHELGQSRYIWLGTRKLFDTFTFAFRESAHGVFQVHAYPFSRDASTFIVECHESTWRRAGLDRAGEAYSTAYCEELFSDLLDGHPLMSNRSHWIRFDTLRCERWRHENVVLLGDAAHTAHFSIGSGTKLALEDATALAAAVATAPGVDAALDAYEAERKRRVLRIQEAADHSRRWFETTDRRMRLGASELAFSLLGRVPKLGRDALATRDELFVGRVERAFAQAYGASDGTHPTNVPFRMGSLRLDGRIARNGRGGDDAALRFLPLGASRPARTPSVATVSREPHEDWMRVLEGVRRAGGDGFGAVELWADPEHDADAQVQLFAAARDVFSGPIIARLESTTGIPLARALGRAGVHALHVPAHVAEAHRLETDLPVIAIAPEFTDDDVATALLAGRADLVDRG